jgi:hypothetical protein
VQFCLLGPRYYCVLNPMCQSRCADSPSSQLPTTSSASDLGCDDTHMLPSSDPAHRSLNLSKVPRQILNICIKLEDLLPSRSNFPLKPNFLASRPIFLLSSAMPVILRQLWQEVVAFCVTFYLGEFMQPSVYKSRRCRNKWA